MSIGATLDRRLVEPAHVTLTRTVAGGMTVQTARMRQHLPSSVNIAADRAAGSLMDEKLSTLARGSDALSEAA
jgi:hypothetical protein